MKEDRRDTAPEAGASLTAGEADDGCRVDALLSRLVPGMGVRGRRRFLKEGRALLNGHPVKAGTAVRAGDRLEIVPLKVYSSSMPEARLLARRGGFRVFLGKRARGRQEERVGAENSIKSAKTLCERQGLRGRRKSDFLRDNQE